MSEDKFPEEPESEDPDSPWFSKDVIVEIHSHGNIRGVFRTFESEVGKRIKECTVTVELLPPANGVVTTTFRDLKIVKAPDRKMMAVWNSRAIRHVKIREAKIARIRALFGGGDTPAPAVPTETRP